MPRRGPPRPPQFSCVRPRGSGMSIFDATVAATTRSPGRRATTETDVPNTVTAEHRYAALWGGQVRPVLASAGPAPYPVAAFRCHAAELPSTAPFDPCPLRWRDVLLLQRPEGRELTVSANGPPITCCFRHRRARPFWTLPPRHRHQKAAAYIAATGANVLGPNSDVINNAASSAPVRT